VDVVPRRRGSRRKGVGGGQQTIQGNCHVGPGKTEREVGVLVYHSQFQAGTRKKEEESGQTDKVHQELNKKKTKGTQL